MYAPSGLIISVDSYMELTTDNFKGVDEQAFVHVDFTSPNWSQRDRSVELRLRAGLPVVTHALNAANATGLVHLAQRLHTPVTVVTDRVDLWPADVLVTSELFGVLHDTRFVTEFDIIGDVHGQFDALREMLDSLGHQKFGTTDYIANRRLVVLTGDTINKGPRSLEVLQLLQSAVQRGQAVVVKGNNEHWLERKLSEIASHTPTPDEWSERLLRLAVNSPARRRPILRDLAESPERLDGFASLRLFLARMPLLARLDSDSLWACHASVPKKAMEVKELTPELIRKWSVHFMYGPIGNNGHRPDWVANYKGEKIIVRGHVTVPSPEVRNRVISLDTGAGESDGDSAALSAVRWPQAEFKSVIVRQPA